LATIAVVDDDQEIRQIVPRILAPLGHKVVTAIDGVAAEYLLDKSVPDLLIIDLSMPRKGGWDLINAIHQNPEWSKAKIMILTASSGFVERSIMSRLSRVDSYVTKPFKPEALRDAVREVLSTKA